MLFFSSALVALGSFMILDSASTTLKVCKMPIKIDSSKRLLSIENLPQNAVLF